jgi:hypothetical protein
MYPAAKSLKTIDIRFDLLLLRVVRSGLWRLSSTGGWHAARGSAKLVLRSRTSEFEGVFAGLSRPGDHCSQGFPVVVSRQRVILSGGLQRER